MNNSEQPAFQTAIGMSNSEIKQMGLTKREYFAGLAMQGIVSNSISIDNAGPIGSYEKIAKRAVLIADNLLKQLEQ